MNHQHKVLSERIDQVYRRWKRMLILKGGAKALVVTISALVLAFVVDTLFELGPTVLLVLLTIISAGSLITLYLVLIRPLLRAPTQKQLARYIEERHPELEDRLVSAVELGGTDDPRISAQILEKLLDDTRFHIEPLNLPRFIPATGASVWGSVALALAAFFGALVLTNVDFFTLKSNRLFTPWNIPTLKKLPSLQVSPGNSRVPNGSALEIRAQVSGFEAEEALLYLSSDDSTWTKLQMDQTELAEVFVYNFFNVESPTRYYVKTEDEISDIYRITVYNAPKIKRVDLTYDYPKYTGLKSKKERDAGDVWAPEGTTVKIVAIADKPLSQASIILGESRKLKTTVRADTILTARLKVTHDTFYKIHITDNDGLTNHLPPEYYVHALPDQPPLLSIARPGRDIKASMVEEVPIRIAVEDDYGLASLKLIYSVNDSPDETVSLPLGRVRETQEEVVLNEIQEFSSEHMFYLEDMNVEPGDFLTYYVQASDNQEGGNSENVESEFFFIEIRPFEQEFFRALSQGQQAGGGGGPMPGRLSRTQRDIIVATRKVHRKREKLDPVEFKGNADAITESQENLREVTESTIFQLQQRAVLSRESSAEIVKAYSEALEAMEQALDLLKQQKLEDALTPQKKALAGLLSAEASITENQMQQGQGGGGGNPAALEELAQLFEEEMDDLKNKYETNEEIQRQQDDQAVNEALEKVKELARRQQLLNQKLRDLARKQLTPEEKKRQIQELRRQQENMRREADQLARNMQNQQQRQSSLSREMQDNLRRTTSDMNNASNNLRQDNAGLAAAKGQKAVNRLKKLEEMLQRNQKESLRRQFDALDQQFEQLADAQQKLTKDVETLSKGGEESAAADGRLEAQKDQAQLKEKFEAAEAQANSLSQKAQSTRNQASRHLRDFSRELEKSQIGEKMASAGKLLEQDRLNSALQAERDIENQLSKLTNEFNKVRGTLAETDEEKLDLALDQTRKLRENLESLKSEMQGSNRPANQQGGEEQGDKPQEMAGRQSPKTRQSGPGENRGAPQQLDPTKLDWWDSELAQAMKDLEFIGKSTQVDTSLSRQARNLHQNLAGVLRTFSGGDENRLTQIEAQILNPLRTFEAELAQKLELIKNREKLFLAREEKIPPEYLDLVEKYYEAISKTK